MKVWKKLLALDLALLMMLSLLPVPVFAAPEAAGTCGEGLTWTLEDGVLTVSGQGAMADYAHGEAPWYHAAGAVSAVVVESGVTRVGDYAFAELAMSQVSLPAGLQTIGSYAFSYGSFTEIALPDTVTAIGHHAFESCLLKEVILPSGVTTVEEHLFNWCADLTAVTLGAGVQRVADNAFAYCDALETIRIDALERESALDLTTLPAGVAVTYRSETVASGTCGAQGDDLTWELDSAGILTIRGEGEMEDFSRTDMPWYSWNDAIKIVLIEDGVINVANNAFAYAENLLSVTLGTGVTVIGNSAFTGCSALTAIDLKNVVDIGYRAFSKTGLTSLTLGKSVEAVRHSAFYSCPALKDIHVLGDPWFYGVDIFADCPVLEEIEWRGGRFPRSDNASIFRNSGHEGNGITLTIGSTDVTVRWEYDRDIVSLSVPARMFYTSLEDNDAPNLTKVQVPLGAQVYGVEQFAFYNCPTLKEVDLGHHMFWIYESAFEHCTGLEQVTWQGSMYTIAENAFRNTGLKRLEIGFNTTRFGEGAFADNGDDFTLYVHEGSDALAYAEQHQILYAIREDKPVFVVDGISYPWGKECSGDGWEYYVDKGYGILELEDYCGGDIVLPEESCIYLRGENIINGTITANSALRINAINLIKTMGSLTINSGNEPAITTPDLSVEKMIELTIHSTADAAIEAGFVRFFGGDTITIHAAKNAVKADVVKVNNHDIYLSENGSAAEHYAESPYLRLEIHTYTYTLHANGGGWVDEPGEEKVVELSVIQELDPDDYLHLLVRDGYRFYAWENDDSRIWNYKPGDVIRAFWIKDALLIGGQEYEPYTEASGIGWNITSSGFLTINAAYTGEPIFYSNDLEVTIHGPVTIHAPDTTPAIKTLGILTVNMYGDILLHGGSGAAGIEANGGVTVNNYGTGTICGGDGKEGIFNRHPYMDETKVKSDGHLTIQGGTGAWAIEGSLDFQQHKDGVLVLIGGSENDGWGGGSIPDLDPSVKVYVGEDGEHLERYGEGYGWHDYNYIRIEPKSIRVNFDANGGTICDLGVFSADIPQDVDNAFVVTPEMTAVLPGYCFAGWNTEPDGSGDHYTVGQTYTAGVTDDVLTLYAQWETLLAEVSPDGETVAITLAEAVPEGTQLLLTAYDRGGRMLHCAEGTGQDARWVFSILQDPDIDHWSLFRLDGGFAPIGAVLPVEISTTTAAPQ